MIKKDKYENSDILILEEENSEEIDEELSELASKIINSNKSNYPNNIISDNSFNKNDNKMKNRIFFKIFNKNKNIPEIYHHNYSINNVDSLFILNKKENSDEIKQNIQTMEVNNFCIEKLNIEINSYKNSKYFENKKILSNFKISKKPQFQEHNIDQKYLKNKNQFKLIIEKVADIYLLTRIYKKDNIKIDEENLNNKKRTVKFDARILTIYYNKNDKVPELNIKDNQNQIIEFVPLDMKQYLKLLTSNKELRPLIINKSISIKKNYNDKKTTYKKNFTKLLKNNLKKLQNKKRDKAPFIKNKNQLINDNKVKDNAIIKEKLNFKNKINFKSKRIIQYKNNK